MRLVHSNGVVGKAPGHGGVAAALRANQLKQLMRGGTAQLAVVLENDQPAHSHFTPGCGMIILKHIQDGRPKQVQISLRKARALAGQIGRYIPLCPVQAIGNDILTAHFDAFFLCISFGGNG